MALAEALHAAVASGARAAISGYPSSLYDELYADWRRVDHDVALLGTRAAAGMRRTECLWMSYPREMELSYVAQGELFRAAGAP